MLDGKAGYASASGGVDASGADPEAAGVLAAAPAVRAGPEDAAAEDGRRVEGPGSRAGPEVVPGTALDAALAALGVGLVAGPEVGLGATGPAAEPGAGPDAGPATGSTAGSRAGPASDPGADLAVGPASAPEAAVDPASYPEAEPGANPEATTLPSSPRTGAGAGISSPSKTSSRVVNSSASTAGLNLSSSRFGLSVLIVPPSGSP